MKRRYSITTAAYSVERSARFERDCNDILFDRKMKLEIEGNDVYLLNGDRRTHLHTITNPKTKWFEIWLKLREV